EVAPKPVIEVAPKRVIEVVPEPIVEVISETAVEIKPEPVKEPEPVVEVEPEPVVEIIPEPVVEAAPEPVVEVAPEPIVEIIPEPVAEVVPEPVAKVADDNYRMDILRAISTVLGADEPEEEEPEEEEDEEKIVVVGDDGRKFILRNNYSFTARFIQAGDETQKRYGIIKNSALSFDGVKSNVSWKQDRIYCGRQAIGVFVMRGKTLKLCLALDPNEVDSAKYHTLDVSNIKRFEKTQTMLRIRTDRSMAYAIELIGVIAEKLGLAQGKIAKTSWSQPFEETQALIEKGLIKVNSTEEKK
ncbi:MAG: hypothetical protein RR993_01415, partial [Clostridia bacterium]